MGYSQLRVLLGGLFHVPVLIGLFWLADNLFSKGYQEQKAKEAKAKAKAIALEKAKKEAEEKLKAELAANTEGSPEGIEKVIQESETKDQPSL